MKKSVLVLGGMLPGEIKILQESFNVIRLNKESDPQTILDSYHKDIVAVVSTPFKGVGKSLIDALPNLEIVCQHGIGVDNIDVAYAADRGIAVTNTPDLVTEDTADIGMALMLGIMRRTMEGDMYVRVGKWLNGPMGLGSSLTGKTMGIIGMGRIGRAMARRASAFGMNVVYYSRTEKKDVLYDFYNDLEKMASVSDILMVCCSGGEETKNLVDGAILNALGEEGYLVNIARGSVVNEQDLLVALSNKSIAGAGMDVFWEEPYVPEGLVSMDNVVLLPHIGTATRETRGRMGRLVIENLLAHFEGRPLKTPVAA